MEKQWAHDQTIHVTFSTGITLHKSHGTGLGLLREVAAMTQSGPLTALIWKKGHQDSGWRYQFSLFRQLKAGKVSQMFRPLDLMYFIKLLQVVAAVIADDGCLSPIETGVLRRVEQDLDQLLQRASQRRPSSNATSSPENTGVDDEKSSSV